MPLKLIKKLPRNIVTEFVKWRCSLGFIALEILILVSYIFLH